MLRTTDQTAATTSVGPSHPGVKQASTVSEYVEARQLHRFDGLR